MLVGLNWIVPPTSLSPTSRSSGRADDARQAGRARLVESELDGSRGVDREVRAGQERDRHDLGCLVVPELQDLFQRRVVGPGHGGASGDGPDADLPVAGGPTAAGHRDVAKASLARAVLGRAELEGAARVVVDDREDRRLPGSRIAPLVGSTAGECPSSAPPPGSLTMETVKVRVVWLAENERSGEAPGVVSPCVAEPPSTVYVVDGRLLRSDSRHGERGSRGRLLAL